MPKVLSPSDKFQMRGQGDLRSPGSCMCCGSGTCQEGYIDLATFFDWEGQMYMCAFCLEEAAEVLGMLTRAESAHLQQLSGTLATENKELKVALDAANQRLHAFDLALGRTDSSDPIGLRVVSDVPAEAPSETDGTNSEPDDLPAASADSGESEPKEPVKVERRSDAARSKLSDSGTENASGLDL